MDLSESFDDNECLPSIHLRKWGSKQSSLKSSSSGIPPTIDLTSPKEFENTDSKPPEKKRSKTRIDSLTDSCSSSTSSSSDDEEKPTKPKRIPSRTVRRGLTRKGASLAQDTQTESCTDSRDSPPLFEGAIYSGRVQRCFMDIAKNVVPENIRDVVCVEEADETETQEKPQKHSRQREMRAKEEVTPEAVDVEAFEEPMVIADDDDDYVEPPSPPRMTKPSKTGRIRMKRGVRAALRELTQAKKAKMNDSLVSDPDEVVLVEDTPNPMKEEISVKVMYIGVIKKFVMKTWEPFGNIVPQVAEAFGIKEEGVSFFLQDRSLPSTDTPNMANLKIVDIIECHVIENRSEEEVEGADIPYQERIELYVQRRNCRKRVKIVMSKHQSLRYLMEKYAAKVKLDFTKLRFMFDGDNFGPESTPTSMDMSDGDCIDVIA